jgi:hypothetical protein
MTPPLGLLWRASLALIVAVAFTLGIAAVGCGPDKKFCPDAAGGNCPIIEDAAPKPDIMDAPEEDRGSVFVPQG